MEDSCTDHHQIALGCHQAGCFCRGLWLFKGDMVVSVLCWLVKPAGRASVFRRDMVIDARDLSDPAESDDLCFYLMRSCFTP